MAVFRLVGLSGLWTVEGVTMTLLVVCGGYCGAVMVALLLLLL